MFISNWKYYHCDNFSLVEKQTNCRTLDYYHFQVDYKSMIHKTGEEEKNERGGTHSERQRISSV